MGPQLEMAASTTSIMQQFYICHHHCFDLSFHCSYVVCLFLCLLYVVHNLFLSAKRMLLKSVSMHHIFFEFIIIIPVYEEDHAMFVSSILPIVPQFMALISYCFSKS